MALRLKRRDKGSRANAICPIIEVIKTIVTESRLLVVRHLFTGPKGFNELWRESGINSKTLSATLKFLEQQGIVSRKILNTRPFNVQYSLTESGLGLRPALEAFGNWGTKWLPEFNGSTIKNKHAAITQEIPKKWQC